MKLLLLVVLFPALVAVAPAGTAAPPRVGDPAPGFRLPYATRDSIAGDSLSLAAFAGRRNDFRATHERQHWQSSGHHTG